MPIKKVFKKKENIPQIENVEKRNFINLLRGIAIFLMLWGHSIQYCSGGQFDSFENYAFKFIYSFHMPFFMLISGYLFFFSAQKRETFELIEYKAKSLLYPILMCSLLNFILTEFAFSILNLSFFDNLPKFLGGTQITSLWFLWSVLACSLVVTITMKTIKNKLLQFITVVLGIVLVAILPCGVMNVYMYPYFVMGYVFAKNEERLKKAQNIFSVFSCLIFVVMFFFFKKKHYIYTSGIFGGLNMLDNFKIDVFRWAIGFFGSVTIIFISRGIYKFIKKVKISTTLESLGQNSLAVYVLSSSLLSFWLPKLSNKVLALLPIIDWNKYVWLYNLVITTIVATIYSVVLLIIIQKLKKVNIYRLIFGR